MSFDEEPVLAREAQLIFSNVQGFNMSDSLRVWRGKVRAGSPNNQDYNFEFIFPHGFPKQKPVIKALTPMTHSNVTSDGYVELDILERWRPEFHGYQVLLQLISLLKRSPPTHGPASGTRYGQQTMTRGSVPSPSTQQYRQSPSNSNSQNPKFENFKRVTNRDIGIASRDSGEKTPRQTQEVQDSAILKKQLSEIRDQMTKQEEELARMRARSAIGIDGESQTSGQQKILQDSFSHLKTNDQVADIESEQIAISELMAGLQEKHQTGEISIFDYSKLYKKYSRDLFILRKKLEYIKEKQ